MLTRCDLKGMIRVTQLFVKSQELDLTHKDIQVNFCVELWLQKDLSSGFKSKLNVYEISLLAYLPNSFAPFFETVPVTLNLYQPHLFPFPIIFVWTDISKYLNIRTSYEKNLLFFFSTKI